MANQQISPVMVSTPDQFFGGQQIDNKVPTALPRGTVKEDFLPALAFPPDAPINQLAQFQQPIQPVLPDLPTTKDVRV